MSLVRNIILIIATVLGIYFLAVYAVNIFSHLDPPRLCYISISGDLVSGNEDTIHDALRLLRREDPDGYKTVCRHVDRINEMYCQGADPRGGESEEGEVGWENPGCYIRGSRVIQVKPERNVSEDIIRARAETIKKYAEYSRDFWDSQ